MNENNKKGSYILIVFFLMLFSFTAGMYVSGKNQSNVFISKPASTSDSSSSYIGKILGKYNNSSTKMPQDVDFNLYWDVWDSVKSNYVDKGKISEKEMFYGSLKGMVDSLKDPYTVFMDPKITKEFDDDLAGTFEGIGAEIGIRDDVLTIIAPLADTPAEKAGLKPGDKILSINGESSSGLSIDQAVKKIRGEKGTEVSLSIMTGVNNPKEVKITRGLITIKSIKTKLRDDGVYVLEISNFGNDTIDLFNEAVKDIVNKKPKGLIVDLRNNPGGYLESAIELASEWVEKGVVVSEQKSNGDKEDYSARGKARLRDIPTVILVNQGSASASEILAGALQDHKKAKVVGKQTYGKGSVQTIRSFPDGSSVKITIAKWLTPNGICINEKGIKPDEEIDYKIEDFRKETDPQFNRALELLGGKFDKSKEKSKK